jgi:anti-sigma regulatory factor (Ser/Thr protein kinase)
MYRQNTSTQAWEICAKYNDFASLESSVQETIINAIQYAHKNLVEIKYTKQ